jgi:excinuclease UvrABC ATPase subunit
VDTVCSVGLDYIKLGQSALTLSGGEAQRVKLSLELSKIGTGKTLYVLDEPTTGLHFADVKKLMEVLNGWWTKAIRRVDRAQPGRDQAGRLGDRPGA